MEDKARAKLQPKQDERGLRAVVRPHKAARDVQGDDDSVWACGFVWADGVKVKKDMRAKEDSLRKALEAASLQQRGLPPRLTANKGGFWIKAIVLVQKRNLEECYCLYQQNEDGYMRLLRDFGSPSQILCIKSIHPYMYLDAAQFMPSGGLASKRFFYKNVLGGEQGGIDVDALDEAELDKLLLRNAINAQLAAEESARQQNLRDEGSDLDGTNNEDIARVRFEAELESLKRSGASKSEMAAFKESFERSISDKSSSGGDVFLPEDEKIRQEMESADTLEREEPPVSVAGEFDAPEIDLAELRKATEEYRKEQILVAKRKWKREHDGEACVRSGFACVNESGEKEEIETLQLPDINQAPEQKRKPGRPKKRTASPTTRKRRVSSKSSNAKAGRGQK